MSAVGDRADARVGRAIAIAAPIITLIIVVLFAISFIISNFLGLPPSLGLPVAVRAAGGVVVIAGLGVMVWLFRYRGPANIIVSTSVTLGKMFGSIPLAEQSVRVEPLVVGGPQKYVRHPLYLGVVIMVLGWALLTAYAFVFIGSLAVFLWFRLAVIPFEERELRALFGQEYKAYSDETPTIIPFTRRRKREAT